MKPQTILPARVILMILISLIINLPAEAQWTRDNRILVADDGILMGGMGFAFIDDESFFVFNLRTELSFGQFGVGIDVPLRFSTNSGQLREEDWNSTYDYSRALRYIRYGVKRRTPVYARVGTLDAARLGHGFIMNYYTNEIQYDARNLGLEFDLKFNLWGVESVVSNFDQFDVVGGRAYVLPLRNMQNLGILNRLTFGATVVTDHHPEVHATETNVTIGGVDVELPLLSAGPFFSLIYADYAKIQKFGSGKSVGVQLGLSRLGGLVDMQAKLERRFLGKQFLPSYFNPFYENERFQITPDGSARKTEQLLLRTSSEHGIYGELFGDVVNVVKLLGTFGRIDGQENSGRLHLAALLSRSVANFTARAIYDKTGIEGFSDAFTLDERSIARLGLGYQINPYIFLYMDYIWTYQFNEITQSLETQRRVEPQIAFVFPIGFGQR